MLGPDKLGRSIPSRNHRRTSVPRRRPSAGESQMAVTAIDHGGRLVTVTSIHDECLRWPLNAPMWRAESWSASLQNHAAAVNQVIKLIALDADPTD
jgi:hypothetical protein